MAVTDQSALLCVRTEVRTQGQPCTSWLVMRLHCERCRREPRPNWREGPTIVDIWNTAMVGDWSLQIRLTLSRMEKVPQNLRLPRQQTFLRWCRLDQICNRCAPRLRRVRTESRQPISNKPHFAEFVLKLQIVRHEASLRSSIYDKSSP